MSEYSHQPTKNYLIGTAHWCGTYDSKPAFVLSSFSGASLWVYDGGWVVVKRGPAISDVLPHEVSDDWYKRCNGKAMNPAS